MSEFDNVEHVFAIECAKILSTSAPASQQHVPAISVLRAGFPSEGKKDVAIGGAPTRQGE